MRSSTIPLAAASAVFLFLSDASPSRADGLTPPSVQSAEAGPDEPLVPAEPLQPRRGQPPTPAQLDRLHQSLEQQAPNGFESRPKYGLIIAGAATFAVSYLATAAVTASVNAIDCSVHDDRSGCGSERALYIPVGGPILHLVQSGSLESWIGGPFMVISSLAQLTGLSLMVAGSLARDRVPIKTHNRPQYILTPALSTAGIGVQALVRY